MRRSALADPGGIYGRAPPQRPISDTSVTSVRPQHADAELQLRQANPDVTMRE